MYFPTLMILWLYEFHAQIWLWNWFQCPMNSAGWLRCSGPSWNRIRSERKTFLVDETLLCNLVKHIKEWVAVTKGKVWKESWTAQQTDFHFMPFGSLVVWVSPILPTYIKLRLLGFWYISWYLLRVSLSCSGCVYTQYSITCLLSRPKRLSCDHCQWSVITAIYPWEPTLSHPTPSPLTLACLCFSSAMAAFGQAEGADWCTSRVFCTWDSFFSYRDIFFIMETPLALSCFSDKTGWIWEGC